MCLFLLLASGATRVLAAPAGHPSAHAKASAVAKSSARPSAAASAAATQGSPRAESTDLDMTSIAVAAGGAIVVGVIGGVLVWRRRRESGGGGASYGDELGATVIASRSSLRGPAANPRRSRSSRMAPPLGGPSETNELVEEQSSETKRLPQDSGSTSRFKSLNTENAPEPDDEPADAPQPPATPDVRGPYMPGAPTQAPGTAAPVRGPWTSTGPEVTAAPVMQPGGMPAAPRFPVSSAPPRPPAAEPVAQVQARATDEESAVTDVAPMVEATPAVIAEPVAEVVTEPVVATAPVPVEEPAGSEFPSILDKMPGRPAAKAPAGPRPAPILDGKTGRYYQSILSGMQNSLSGAPAPPKKDAVEPPPPPLAPLPPEPPVKDKQQAPPKQNTPPRPRPTPIQDGKTGRLFQSISLDMMSLAGTKPPVAPPDPPPPPPPSSGRTPRKDSPGRSPGASADQTTSVPSEDAAVESLAQAMEALSTEGPASGNVAPSVTSMAQTETPAVHADIPAAQSDTPTAPPETPAAPPETPAKRSGLLGRSLSTPVGGAGAAPPSGLPRAAIPGMTVPGTPPVPPIVQASGPPKTAAPPPATPLVDLGATPSKPAAPRPQLEGKTGRYFQSILKDVQSLAEGPKGNFVERPFGSTDEQAAESVESVAPPGELLSTEAATPAAEVTPPATDADVSTVAQDDTPLLLEPPPASNSSLTPPRSRLEGKTGRYFQSIMGDVASLSRPQGGAPFQFNDPDATPPASGDSAAAASPTSTGEAVASLPDADPADLPAAPKPAPRPPASRLESKTGRYFQSIMGDMQSLAKSATPEERAKLEFNFDLSGEREGTPPGPSALDGKTGRYLSGVSKDTRQMFLESMGDSSEEKGDAGRKRRKPPTGGA